MAHRGIYSFDAGVSSTSGLGELPGGGAAAKKRQQELAAKAIPLWMKAAPRAAAKAYVERLNQLVVLAVGGGERRSATELLFDLTPLEISVTIPLSLAGFTIAQLQLPKGSVIIAERTGSKTPGKKLDISPSVKLEAGDKLVLRGTPHAIAGVAAHHKGQVVLLKPTESSAMRAHLKGEKESLSLASRELCDRLMPFIRKAQVVWQRQGNELRAAKTIQKSARGMLTRAQYAYELEGLRRLRLRGRLGARRYVAEIVRRQYEGPILNRRLLKHLSLPPSAASALQGMTFEDGEVSLFAVMCARRLRVAQSYKASINKLLGAAPEAKELGAPLTLLGILASGPVGVTARHIGSEVTMKALNLPPDVTVTHANINKVKKTIKGVRGLDPTQKLLKGDTLTLNAAVHRLAAVAEVKNGALSLALSSKSAQADAEALEKGRTLLLTVANKIAIWLQGAVRERVAQRARARRAHAALVIQLAFATFRVKQRLDDDARGVSKSFVNKSSLHKALGSTGSVRGAPSVFGSSSVLGGDTSAGFAGPSAIAPIGRGGGWGKLKLRHSVASKLGSKAKQKKRPMQREAKLKARNERHQGSPKRSPTGSFVARSRRVSREDQQVEAKSPPKAKRSDRSGEILVDQKRMHYATVAV